LEGSIVEKLKIEKSNKEIVIKSEKAFNLNLDGLEIHEKEAVKNVNERVKEKVEEFLKMLNDEDREQIKVILDATSTS
jgi:Mg/Co/Ni transporter MgtE